MPKIQYLETFADAGWGWQWSILIVCVMPAIFEELAFRGFIQTSLARVLGDRDAIFASALMFAILHLSMVSIPHLLVLGIALAVLRLKTKSLYPGMVLHFSHNFLVVLSEHFGQVLPW
jgi:membrane protease YdiL (CAAX protease family)